MPPSIVRPQQQEPTAGYNSERASAGVRWWARSFDLALWINILSVLWEFTAIASGWSKSDSVPEYFAKWQLELGLVTCVALLLDALIYAWFGNTPGKALMGIIVRHQNGEPLTAAEYRTRNLQLFAPGLGFALIPLSLIGQFLSYRKYKTDGYTAWDQEKRYVVERRPLKVWKVLIFVLVVVFWQMLSRISAQYTTHELNELVRAGIERENVAPAQPTVPTVQQIYRAPAPERSQSASVAPQPQQAQTPTNMMRVVSASQSDGSTKTIIVWPNPITGQLATLPQQWRMAWEGERGPGDAPHWKFMVDRGNELEESCFLVFEKEESGTNLTARQYIDGVLGKLCRTRFQKPAHPCRR
jgi:uncharacterized RDD family membrane protein YckC